MKITVIASSNRSQSQSTRISNLVQQRYQTEGLKVGIIDFAVENIPFWEESIWEGNWAYQAKWNVLADKLAKSDGFVFVVPEWSGMVPPFLKNFFLLCSTELAHKPSLIVGISSGMGGSYPIAELRMSSFKNTHVLWIPEQVVIRECEGFDFEADEYQFVANRFDFCMQALTAYGLRLKGLASELEASGSKKHRYGM